MTDSFSRPLSSSDNTTKDSFSLLKWLQHLNRYHEFHTAQAIWQVIDTAMGIFFCRGGGGEGGGRELLMSPYDSYILKDKLLFVDGCRG